MKAFNRLLVSLLILVPLTVGAQNYAQLSSSENQRVLPNQEPTAVFFDTVDAENGVTIIDDTLIVLGEDGLYFQMWAPQVDRGSSARALWFDLWTSTNGVDDPNSNIRLQFAPGGRGNSSGTSLGPAPSWGPVKVSTPGTAVVPAQSIGCFNAGDTIQVLMSGASEDIGLVVIEPDGEPRIPAIIGTIFRIGDC